MLPLICIVTDKDFKLQTWEEMDLLSSGIMTAEISQEEAQTILTVSAVCGWFYGKGIHQYVLNSSRIEDFGNVQYTQFQKGENNETLLVPFLTESEIQSLNLKYSKRLRNFLIENRKQRKEVGSTPE